MASSDERDGCGNRAATFLSAKAAELSVRCAGQGGGCMRYPPLGAELRPVRRALLCTTALLLLRSDGHAARGSRPRLRASPKLGDRRRNVRDGAVMVFVPPGTFQMGSEDGFSDERPVHPVRIRRGYWIYETEVTNTQYRKFLQANPGRAQPEWWRDARFVASQLPVLGVRWSQAAAYCKWVGGRLPTEAEWEYAARGTGGRRYPWGNEGPANDQVVFGLDRQTGAPERVGGRMSGASWCGTLDMAGNAAEWCVDWYYIQYPAESQVDPVGPPDGRHKVLRGGGWCSILTLLRATSRASSPPGYREPDQGFRPVLPQ